MSASVRPVYPWFGIVAAVVVALAAAVWFRQPSVSSLDDASSAASGANNDAVSILEVPPGGSEVSAGPEPAAPAGLTVHVSGEVLSPGLVSLAPGTRVADALAAAGGTLASADLGRLNLAAPVADGEHVLVPSILAPGAPAAPDAPLPASAGAQPGDLVHLNTATVAELETLPGVGPVLAGRIVDHRERDGPFTVVEDLLDVSGIGEARLESLRDLVAIP